MKKKFLYMLTALMAVTATSCKDDLNGNAVDNPADLDRMPRTMFCTQESTGDDNETNVHCVTEELNTIYLSWFKVTGAAGYQLRYAISTGVTSGEAADWDKNRAREIFIGKNVMDVVPADIAAKARVFQSIRDLEELTDLKAISDEDEYVIVCEDLNEFKLYNLEYSTDYRFAIKVLSPRGPEHDSEWYGYGDGRHWAEYCGMGTEERYATPVLVNYEGRGNNSIDFTINLNADNAMQGVDAADVISYKQNFGWNADSTMFNADMIRIIPDVMTPNAALDPKWKEGVKLTDLGMKDGVVNVHVDGLDENTVYIVNLINSDIPVAVDSYYNTLSLRTSGERGEPILIEHTWEKDTNLVAHEYKACRIDTILRHFMDDNKFAEGQVFHLEGGKLYYFASSVSLYKGFTLETRPEDVAKGLRAKVYMGGLVSKQGNKDIGTVGQLVLGRSKNAGEADAPIIVESIKFNNLDIEAPEALNIGKATDLGKGVTGNYFVNMLSNGMGVTFDSFEVHNCTFQGLIRGFFRVQGSKVKVFNKIVVDNCVFYNCGYYAANGSSYCMFAGDGKSPKSNVFKDVRFTNNTMYDSPWGSLFNDNNKSLAWPESTKYSIRIENNTFINRNTRASGRYILDFRIWPSGSTLAFKNNLIVLAKDVRDIRNMNNCWGDVRSINGTTDGIPQITLDVENNYSAGCLDAHLKDDGIWSAGAPSANKNSLGSLWNATPGLLQSGPDHSLGSDALITRVGKVALLSTELFANPNPRYFAHDPGKNTAMDHIGPADIWNDLRIVPSGRATSDHEILAKRIGAPRWYSADPKTFTIE